MGDGIDMGKGLSRVLRRLIPTEGFVRAVLGLLLGKEGSAARLDMMLRDESYGQTLNEVVAAAEENRRDTGEVTGVPERGHSQNAQETGRRGSPHQAREKRGKGPEGVGRGRRGGR